MNFGEISAQWPLLGGALVFCAALLRIVQGQYERMLADRDRAIEARDATIAGRLAAIEEGVDDLAGVVKELVALARQEAQPARPVRRPNGRDQ